GGRGMDGAERGDGAAGRHGLGFGGAQDVAVHLVVARPERPGFPLREIGGAGRDVNQAGAAKSRVEAELLVELAPYLQALLRQGQLAQIAMLLAAPTPIAAGLLAA